MKDEILGLILRVLAPALRRAAYAPGDGSIDTLTEDMGIAICPRHYYQPFVTRKDLRHELSDVRDLPGIEFDMTKQMDFVCSLEEMQEAVAFTGAGGEMDYRFDRSAFGPGDADLFYGILRKTRPRRIVEIGCGSSTKLARAAIAANRQADPAYVCEHICIEPYEQPWLERFGVEIIRERVERCDPAIFQALGADDILFIDSSHIIRPQGDVVTEILQIIPKLVPGVLIHVHDIFTPRDYPDAWVLGRRLLWNEQYLLEAFLSFNSSFEIVAMLNWLTNQRRAELAAIMPGLRYRPDAQPGSLWFRRV